MHIVQRDIRRLACKHMDTRLPLSKQPIFKVCILCDEVLLRRWHYFLQYTDLNRRQLYILLSTHTLTTGLLWTFCECIFTTALSINNSIAVVIRLKHLIVILKAQNMYNSFFGYEGKLHRHLIAKSLLSCIANLENNQNMTKIQNWPKFVVWLPSWSTYIHQSLR